MLPHSSAKLKESRKNKIKDFVNAATVFGVTHIQILNQKKEKIFLRICKLPKGPTLTFNIIKYSLMHDIRCIQNNPRNSKIDYESPPLMVLNGFKKENETSKLISTVLSNLYVPLDVNTIKVHECRRVVLYNYDPERGVIEWRHFGIKRHPPVKGISALMDDKVEMKDVTNFIKTTKQELIDDSKPSIKIIERNVEMTISLVELGPRVDMQLVLAEDGMCEGNVLYQYSE
eukprot:GHVL01011903.1.p1 GENE.GHVL01011903.1~~GHVL01011903.1.p1  ORF type:complete len:230 (+),score=36.67 GHVL01011903.1:234-923(+)